MKSEVCKVVWVKCKVECKVVCVKNIVELKKFEDVGYKLVVNDLNYL